MIIEPNERATAEEIDEFRTALAIVTAIRRNDKNAYRIAMSLSHNLQDQSCAMAAIANLLLQVIDQTSDPITGDSVLDGFRSAAAMASPKK